MTALPSVDIRHTDCLGGGGLPGLADNSVDLILTDPPYHRVKMSEKWDRQWKTDADYLGWIGRLCEQWQRVLKPNGSLYVFASPKMAARVEVEIGQWFHVLNRITWRKPPFSTKAEMFRKGDLRTFFPASEALVFAEHHSPWAQHLEQARVAAGFSRQDVSEVVVGNRSGACWNWEAGIRFPEEQHWQSLRQLLPTLPDYEDIARYFSVTADVPYTDVWDFPTVQHYPGKHVCEKPVPMLEHIIRASSRPGAVVLDCFLGSGATAEACVRLGRDCIGMELDGKWVQRAKGRVARALGQQRWAL